MLVSIEGNMAEFKRSQDTLTDVWREHTVYCQSVPQRWFIGNKVQAKPEMITSAIAKKINNTKEQSDNLLGQ